MTLCPSDFAWRKMPYPSKFTQQLFDAICERLSKGEPLAQICRDAGMPSSNTFRDWCAANEELAIAYARARDEGFDAIALDALHIADDNGKDTRYTKEGQEVADSEWISRSKLRVETRLKLLAKWDPKRYGDKITQEHSGPDGGPIQTQSWVGEAPDDLLRQVASLKAKG